MNSLYPLIPISPHRVPSWRKHNSTTRVSTAHSTFTIVNGACHFFSLWNGFPCFVHYPDSHSSVLLTTHASRLIRHDVIHCIVAICVNSVRVRVKANSNSKSQLQSPSYHQGEEGRRRSSVDTDIASASLFHSLFVYIVNRCIYRCFRWVNFRVNDMIVEVEDEDVCFPVELNGRRPAVWCASH